MTRDQAQKAMIDGARIIAYAGEDTDTGYVHELVDETGRTMARIGWDSCQESWQDIEPLELAP